MEDSRQTSVVLRLSDPAYTERLVSFLRSVGQAPEATAPDTVELAGDERQLRDEVVIYLRVWKVLYPDADVTLER